MADIYCVGVNPINKTIAGSLTAGATTITIPNSTGLPTIPSGSFQTGRLTDSSGTPTENIRFARSTTTLTLFASGTLANSYSAGATLDFDVISQPGLDQIKQDALSGGPHGSNITTTANLVVGIMNYANLTAASVNLTLPTATADGQMCGIQMLDTCTKLATIVGTIDGFTNRIMWANEFAWLAWDSANSMWRTVARRAIPMVAELYYTGSTIGATVDSTYTLVPFNTAGIDNTGLMVNTGASKIVINRPGNYTVDYMAVWLCGSTISNNSQAVVFKNGTGGTQVVGAVGSWSTILVNLYQLAASKTVPAVVTDDFSLAYYQTSGGTTPTLIGGRPTLYLTVTEIPSW